MSGDETSPVEGGLIQSNPRPPFTIAYGPLVIPPFRPKNSPQLVNQAPPSPVSKDALMAMRAKMEDDVVRWNQSIAHRNRDIYDEMQTIIEPAIVPPATPQPAIFLQNVQLSELSVQLDNDFAHCLCHQNLSAASDCIACSSLRKCCRMTSHWLFRVHSVWYI